VTQGLSNANVTCFQQDNLGFMWIGTADGLNRYDGYQFKVYRQSPNEPQGLPDNYITDLCQDASGNFWVATPDGLAKYNPQRDAFERVAELGEPHLLSVNSDAQGNVWIIGDNHFSLLRRGEKKWQPFPGLSSQGINFTDMAQTSSSDYWFGTNGQGLYHLHLPTRKVTHYAKNLLDSTSLGGSSIYRLHADGKGSLWIATFHHGINQLDLATGKFTHYQSDPADPNSLLYNTVRDICPDGNHLLFAVENGGISRLDPATGKFTNYLNNPQNPSSLADNSVWRLYRDHEGRLWVGTFAQGVCVWDQYLEKFARLPISLPNRTVSAVYEDSRGRLWLGTEGGAVMKDGDKISYFKNKAGNPHSLSANPVLSIREDARGNVWLGTWSGGINRYNETTRDFQRFSFPESDVIGNASYNHVFALGQTNDLQLLAGSYGGVSLLNAQGQMVPVPDPFSAKFIHAFLNDDQGNLWTGTLGGLHYWEKPTFDLPSANSKANGTPNSRPTVPKGNSALFVNQPTDPMSLSYNAVFCLLQDRKKRIWAGSGQGLNQVLGQGRFRRFTTEDGLPSNQIMGLAEDQRGRLWITTNQGLAQLDPDRRVFRQYSESDGLLSRQFRANAICLTKSGEIIVGSTQGANIFHPDSLRNNPYPPRVLFTELRVLNKPVVMGAPDSILRQPMPLAKEVRLPHAQSAVFAIDFVGLNFTRSEYNQYAYRLEPFEKDWNYVGTQRSATYTNLPPGTYTFRAKASNNDGLWNEQGATLTVVILAPWWATWWFRALVLALVAGATFAAYRLRTAYLRSQNRQLEESVVRRTRELESLNEELKQQKEELMQQNEFILHQASQLQAANYRKDKLFSIIAHDLRTPLSSLQSILNMLKHGGLSQAEFQQIADELSQDTSQVSELLNNLLFWAKSQMQGAHLAPAQIDLHQLANRQLALFAGQARDKELAITNLIAPGITAWADEHMIDLVLRNLVANAIKFSYLKDYIKLEAVPHANGMVTVTVSDTGMGIRPEDLPRLFDQHAFSTEGTAKEKGTGLGLLLCKDFVEKNGGQIWAESSLGKGSRFSFTLPTNPPQAPGRGQGT
jgi:signal transduction histidine kinase/ligand-binding sensor domain-containing protein